MINWGTIPLNSVIPFVFDTFAGGTGAPITLTGLAVTDIEVYKGTSVTQRSSDSGYALIDTDGIDIDTRTGIHGFSIDTSDNTDAGFYAAGSFYWVVVDAVTVDSQTMRFIAGTFRLCATESVAGVVETDVTHFGGTAGTFSGGRPEVNTSHAAGTAWNSGAITASTIATGAIDADAIADNAIDAGALAADCITAAKIAANAIGASELAADAVAEIADAVWDEDATAHQTQGTFGQAIGDPVADTNTIYKAVVTDATGATVGVDVAAVLVDTAEIGAAGAGLSAIPWNAAWDTEVESEVNDALVVHRLDELVNADSDIDGAAPPTVGSVFHELMSKTAGSFTFDQTTDSLEAIRDKETDIETDTAEIGVAGAGLTEAGGTGDHLTAIDLPDQTMNITGNITGNLSGSVGSVTGAVGSVTGNVGGNVVGSVGSLAAQAKADVNAEVVDTLNVDTYTEPGQEAPGVTISLARKIGYIYKFLRNKITQTSTTLSVFADDAATVDQKAVVSDTGVVYTRGEIESGP